MPDDLESELRAAIARILSSESRKKLIVAGPGTGKTTLFRKVLEQVSEGPDDALALTFINNLKDELDQKLSDRARVFTFHGYCHALLRRNGILREGLTRDFKYFPGLASLIKGDWALTRGGKPPQFVELMRDLGDGEETAFYLERSNYYDAVEFDDSVFRVHGQLRAHPEEVDRYKMVLVDEYQDFNKMEASFIDLLATPNPILIVGDDDQALYAQLRGSSHEFIRSLYHGGEYESFELPFCMRCPQVIVDAIADLVAQARTLGKLDGRIDKPYRFYEPVKCTDSARYPKIRVVGTSVQSNTANYMGQFIAEVISAIPADEVEASRTEDFPTALVIGPIHYLRQIESYLKKQGFTIMAKEDGAQLKPQRQDGLGLLADNERSNLGWRVVLGADEPRFLKSVIRRSVEERIPLIDLVPEDYRQSILDEVRGAATSPPSDRGEKEAEKESEGAAPTIRLTSFEGSKGLSAQHVYIVGLTEGDLPRNASDIKDLEICRLIVALTRTRKQCTLLYTRMFSGKPMRPSPFLGWIRPERKWGIRVDSKFWEALKKSRE